MMPAGALPRLSPLAEPRSELPNRLTLGLLIAGAFCSPMSTWTLFHGYLSLSDGLFLAALLLHFRSALKNIQQFAGVPLSVIAAGVLFGLSGMLTWAIGGPHADPLNAAKLVFSLAVFPVLILITAGTAIAQLERLLLAWLCGATLSAAVAFVSSHGISLIGMYDEDAAAGGRAHGLAYVHNALGYTSALLVPVAVYFWSRRPQLPWRAFSGMCLALLVYALSASGSRSAVLSLALGLLLPALQLLRRYFSVGLLATALGIAALTSLSIALIAELDIVLPSGLANSAFGRLLGASDVTVSNHERHAYLIPAWEKFLENPLLGIGYAGLRYSHMNVLGVMQCGGLLGLLALIMWMLGIMSALVSAAREFKRKGLNAGTYYGLWMCSWSGIIVWAVDGALQPLLLDRNGFILIGVLFALHVRARYSVPHLKPVRASA